MTGVPPPPPASPLPPPAGQHPQRTGSDIVLLVLEILLAAFLVFALIITPLFALIAGTTAESSGTSDATLSAGAILFSLVVFQAIQGGYPWLVEARRGRELKERLRFTWKFPQDIGIGLVLAIICFFGAQITQLVVAALVGLDDTAEASNTDILEDNKGSLLLVAIIFFVVIGAPLVEELLFRGLIMRNLQRWFGSAVAIIASSFLFAIPHWQASATWQETTVLLTALGVVGLVLAIGAVLTNRLGAAIIAHSLFNAAGTIITLAT